MIICFFFSFFMTYLRKIKWKFRIIDSWLWCVFRTINCQKWFFNKIIALYKRSIKRDKISIRLSMFLLFLNVFFRSQLKTHFRSTSFLNFLMRAFIIAYSWDFACSLNAVNNFKRVLSWLSNDKIRIYSKTTITATSIITMMRCNDAMRWCDAVIRCSDEKWFKKCGNLDDILVYKV